MHYLADILDKASELGARDIHLIAPKQEIDFCEIVFRKNRQFIHKIALKSEAWKLLCAYLQFHSGYLYEHRNRFQHTSLGHNGYAIRIAFSPGGHSLICLRLSLKEEHFYDWPKILEHGLSTWRNRGGLMLVVGPVHSGKTTLYYECLKRCALAQESLCSFEDPIERPMDSINQHVMLASDLESIALSALRFDWDIVGVGEIRLLEQLQWLVFLSFSSVRTITTVHAQSLEALQYKIQTLPALIQEQLKEVCTGVFFKKDKHSLCWELSL